MTSLGPYIPRPFKHAYAAGLRAWRYLQALALDGVDTLLRRRHPLAPPRRRIFIGQGDFLRIGAYYVDLFMARGWLQPHHTILDVGSGQGRLALPLTRVLSTGYYIGLEIVPGAVVWCQQAYRDYPHFRFVHADVHNEYYNPGGRYRAAEYRFPCADASFDLIIALSVFTHMLPLDVRHYLQEIRRCLAPTGRAFLSVYSVDDAAREAIRARRTSRRWQVQPGGYYVVDPRVPEGAIAYPEAFWLEALWQAGLQLCEPITYGSSWGGPRAGLPTEQDILLVARADE